MDKNEILEKAKEYGLPYEVEEDNGTEFIWLYEKGSQLGVGPYLRLHDIGGVWYAMCFGIRARCGLSNDQNIMNGIKELAAN